VGEVLKHELSEYLSRAEKDTSWLTFQKPIEFEISPSNHSNGADVLSDT
jgi:hypothetical protein